jgi:molybdenum cofactor cytidylyltransferase
MAKQSLANQNKILIEHIIEQASAVNSAEIIVVLGAFAEQIQPLLAFANVEITKNENWQKGMSSSLQKSWELTQNSDAVLVLLSDQSFVNTILVNLIIEKATETDLPIVATKYNNIVGVPALFKQAVFQY